MVVGSVFFCDLKPLPRPAVDLDLAAMSAGERAIEVLRYNLALLEYRLGSNGWLRAWTLSTIKVLFFLLVPLVGVAILLAVLVPAAAGIAQILVSVEVACKSMFWAVVYLCFTLLAIAAAIAFFGTLSRTRGVNASVNRRRTRSTTERGRQDNIDSRQS